MAPDATETTGMDCAAFGRALDALLDEELAPLEQAEAEAHLAACPPCRAQAQLEGRARAAIRAGLREAMGAGSPAGQAPAALRARIQEALEHERRPLWRRALAPLPLGALAACAAGVLVAVATQGGPDPLVEQAVRWHSRDLPMEVTSASLGPDAVSGWFAGKLDFNPAPPRFPGRADVRLVGARLASVNDRQAAYLRYDLPRGHLGLFILDDPSWHLRDVGRALRVAPAVHVINARGFNVAVWRRNEIVYSLVSDLDEEDLRRLAEAAQGRPPAAGAP